MQLSNFLMQILSHSKVSMLEIKRIWSMQLIFIYFFPDRLRIIMLENPIHIWVSRQLWKMRHSEHVEEGIFQSLNLQSVMHVWL